MPLPTDKKVVDTGKELLGIFKDLAAHAKGILLKGSFVPTAEAAALSRAPHFNQASTPVIVRFSSSTDIPQIPDNDPNGNPRGFALRFVLAEKPRRQHTDIIAHSTPFFPAATPEETLAFFKAVSGAGTNPDAFSAFVAAHLSAQAFLAAPKPTPSAFTHETFYSVNAFKLINAAGSEKYIRYRVVPVAGVDNLDDAAVKTKSATFLFDGVRSQIQAASAAREPIRFRLVAQVAQDGDVTDNNTVHWPDYGPEKRKEVTLGEVTLNSLVEDDAAEQKYLIFDPVPRVDGIESSEDPLLDLRAALYLLSGRERRAASSERGGGE
ncbi:catalase domain containing protein [Grosmannia clavigera kw1407]|uniref:Catalase domain containing protein n=1 Tax=Grosmannia clavigera (strain kw1407 / UAMH 11150) TaxID=655863 RepID=F0XES5_GROCL|nr:catalase domain containing protein [Grosmannia clavigera kw1407]EFX04241.1 catalase domain containing protein [Grosmannia clavigera kw1407]